MIDCGHAVNLVARQSAILKIQDLCNGSTQPKGLNLQDVAATLQISYEISEENMGYLRDDLATIEDQFFTNDILFRKVQAGSVKA